MLGIQFKYDEGPFKSLSKGHKFFVPLENDAFLSNLERDVLIYKNEMLDNLYLASPTIFHEKNGLITHTPINELSYSYVVSTLKNSPYLVLQKKVLFQGKSTKFFIDPFRSPFFQGLDLEFLVFEAVPLLELPNTTLILEELLDETI
jgi:hypothetical protein